MRVTLLVVTVLVTTEAISIQQPDNELMEMQKESGRLSHDKSVQIAAMRQRRFFGKLFGMVKKFLPSVIKYIPKIIKHAPTIINTVKKFVPTIIKAVPTIIKHAPSIIKTVTKLAPTIMKAVPTIIKHAPTIIKTIKPIVKAAPAVIKMLTGGTSNPKKQTVITVKEKKPKKPLFSAAQTVKDNKILAQVMAGLKKPQAKAVQSQVTKTVSPVNLKDLRYLRNLQNLRNLRYLRPMKYFKYLKYLRFFKYFKHLKGMSMVY